MSAVLGLSNRSFDVPDSCRVYRHRAELPGVVALEVSAAVEHCFGVACEDGIFLGLQGQRIVPYSPGDAFSTQCSLASNVAGELVLKDAQYSLQSNNRRIKYNRGTHQCHPSNRKISSVFS